MEESMESEQLKIFNEDREAIGEASREDVHKKGYWHEVFHYWLVSKEEAGTFVYLQLRSKDKKDYPNLLDITAAGHLLANETVVDGVREVKEELGIDVTTDDLISLGVINYCVTKEHFIDKELANVFLHISNKDFGDFALQVEEVAGMFKADFNNFCNLWHGEVETLMVSGFEVNDDRSQILIERHVGKGHFVAHPESFYQTVIHRIKEKI